MAQELASTTQQPKTTKRLRCTHGFALQLMEDIYLYLLTILETHAVSMSILSEKDG